MSDIRQTDLHLSSSLTSRGHSHRPVLNCGPITLFNDSHADSARFEYL
jgi:hypothetical protein